MCHVVSCRLSRCHTHWTSSKAHPTACLQSACVLSAAAGKGSLSRAGISSAPLLLLRPLNASSLNHIDSFPPGDRGGSIDAGVAAEDLGPVRGHHGAERQHGELRASAAGAAGAAGRGAARGRAGRPTRRHAPPAALPHVPQELRGGAAHCSIWLLIANGRPHADRMSANPHVPSARGPRSRADAI